MSRVGVPVVLGRALVVTGFLAAFIYPIFKVIPLIKNESSKMQTYYPKAEFLIKKYYFRAKDQIKSRFNYEVNDTFLMDALVSTKDFSQEFLLSLPSHLGSLFEWVLLVPLFLFFLLQDGRKFKRLVFKVVPNRIFERFYFLTSQFNKKIGDYIFAKVVEALILTAIIMTGLLIVDLRFSVLLAVIVGVTNIIPYV